MPAAKRKTKPTAKAAEQAKPTKKSKTTRQTKATAATTSETTTATTSSEAEIDSILISAQIQGETLPEPETAVSPVPPLTTPAPAATQITEIPTPSSQAAAVTTTVVTTAANERTLTTNQKLLQEERQRQKEEAAKNSPNLIPLILRWCCRDDKCLNYANNGHCYIGFQSKHYRIQNWMWGPWQERINAGQRDASLDEMPQDIYERCLRVAEPRESRQHASPPSTPQGPASLYVTHGHNVTNGLQTLTHPGGIEAPTFGESTASIPPELQQ